MLNQEPRMPSSSTEVASNLQKEKIGRCVPEFFKKAGICSDIRITPTRVRKFYEAAADENLDTTQQQLVADHLKHKLSTAKQNCVAKVNPKKASKAHKVLKSLLHQKPEANKPPSTMYKDLEKQDWQEENKEEQDGGEENQEENLEKGHEEKLEEGHEDNPEEGHEESSEEGHEEVQPRGLVAAEKVVVSSLFGQTIDSGKFITIHEVRQTMWSNLYLRKFVVKADKVKRVADYVRYRTNTVRQTGMHNLPDESDGLELHASPHIHIWIGHNHIWIYMDKTIWECALYVG